jgi:putative ABC transport system permease protein
MLKNYIKIAYKVLLRRKFFTFVSLFGISFTLLVLIVATAFVDYLATPTRPGTRLDRTLYIERCELQNEKNHIYSLPSYYFLDRYVRSMKTPEAVSIHTSSRTVNTYVGTQKLRLDRKYTDEVFWDILEFDFIEGRPYDRDEVANAALVAVIDDRIRKEVFGDQAAVGKYLETTEANYRIVGVFRRQDIPIHSAAAQIYVPITNSRAAMTQTQLYGNANAYVLATDKTDFDLLKAEFAGRLDDLLEDYKGEWDTFICNMGSQSDLLADYVLGRDSDGESIIAVGAIILAMVLFMLFPAINLININLSRIIERSSEIGVRKAFGASSITLTGQFIIENVFLTLLGGAIAFIIALISLETITESGLLPFGNLSINLRVFFYSLIICFFFGLFSGALPAYLMSRLHPVQALRGVGL